MRISERFGLGKSQYELDFVDIDTNIDMPLFLDPYYISKQEFPLAEESFRSLKSYFEFLLKLLRQGKKEEARELFGYLGEPNEICLGMSKGVPAGHGMGLMDANKIFKSLVKSKAFETGLMEDIEDCRIFVPNVDRDKVSDMTANIIRKQLIKYTQEQCELWGIPLTDGVASGHFWESKSKAWENSYTKMLVIDGKKYILVPKRIVSFSKHYTSEEYLQHFVLSYMQSEHLRLNSPLVRERKDKSRYVTKKDIKELDLKLNGVDKERLAEFTVKYPDVFADFKKKTIEKISTISNEEISEIKVSDVIGYLKQKLIGIPVGNKHATEYHHTILGIMELLFYPSLAMPTIEQEIHNGRKRIDIVFDNCAEKGFFKRLLDDMPCRYIMIECKNYKNDIKNPELDQLAGRFSPNRGKFGISACRKIDDLDLYLMRCADTYKDDRGLIIPLTDDDFLQMLGSFENSGSDKWEEILQKRYHDVVMK